MIPDPLPSLLLGAAFGAVLNTILWYLVGVRPRYGYWFCAAVCMVASCLTPTPLLALFFAGAGAHGMCRLISLTFDSYRDRAVRLEDLVWSASTLVVSPAVFRPQVKVDLLPVQRPVVVVSFLHPRLEWQLKQHGFQRRWVITDEGGRVWPIWSRDAESLI